MKNLSYLLLVCMLGCNYSLFAQNEKKSFSLNEAKEYAKENSYLLKNSRADIKSAKKKVWETTAQGLPQVNADFAYSYMLKVPEALEQFANLGALIGKTSGGTPAKTDNSDIRWGATMDIKVTQLIFSGPYLVGLQATKVYENITELMNKKNIDDVIENVENSYVLVLVAQENKAILETTLGNLRNILVEMVATNKEGFIEDTDVDQLRLTVQNVENSLSMLNRQLSLADRLFKFQIGMDISTKIDLTDNLSDLIAKTNLETMASMNFDMNSNINYKLVDNKRDIAKLNLKLSKTQFLPTLAAFYDHNENFNDKAFNMTPPDVVGLSLSLPIFSSGQRIAKVSQARIDFEKANTDKQKAMQGIILEFEQGKTDYLSSLDKYKNNRANMNLSKRIYDKTTIKYKEGVSSSLDLTQTQNQYLQIQSNYYNSVLELFKNKSKLDKILKRN